MGDGVLFLLVRSGQEPTDWPWLAEILGLCLFLPVTVHF